MRDMVETFRQIEHAFRAGAALPDLDREDELQKEVDVDKLGWEEAERNFEGDRDELDRDELDRDEIAMLREVISPYGSQTVTGWWDKDAISAEE